MREVTVYTTRNSVYEVDTTARKIRRLSGKNAPTQHTGTDGAWQDYADFTRNPAGGLYIVWDAERATWTSEVLDVETRALTG